jgi:glycosyltransferase involved in cell wall biosynthesis
MAGHLNETIASVLANLRPGDEYFVIDGASTDGSADVIRRYADRLTGWVSEPDRGYADALLARRSSSNRTSLRSVRV